MKIFLIFSLFCILLTSSNVSGQMEDLDPHAGLIYSIIAPKFLSFNRHFKFIASIESALPSQEPLKIVAILQYEKPPLPPLPPPILDPQPIEQDAEVKAANVTTNVTTVVVEQNNKTTLAKTEFLLDPIKNPSVATSLFVTDRKVLDLTLGWVNFMVTGWVGKKQIFDETFQRLTISEKKVSNILQMDKPIYKAGENVRFRVLTLDPNMIPVEPKNQGHTSITIKDSRNLVVKQWKNLTLYKGVYSTIFPLSNDPNLGNWKIEVKNGKNGDFKRFFQVDEYVLPKFKVDMYLPTYGTFNDTKITVRIDASYTFGKGIVGEAKVRGGMKLPFYYYHPEQNQKQKKLTEKTAKLDEFGKAFFEFDVKDELQLKYDDYETQKEIEFTATITEAFTEKQYNVTRIIVLYRHPYKVYQIGEPTEYKPGLPYSLFVKVTFQDDTPISDPSPDALQVHHGFAYDIEDAFQNYSIPTGGIVKLTFKPPTNTMISINSFEVTYKDLKTYLYPGGRAVAPSNCYLQSTLMTPYIRELNEVAIDVESNKPFTELNIVMAARGDILFRKQIKIPNAGSNTTRYLLKFNLPRRAAPAAHLVIYTFCSSSPNLDVMGDHIKLNIAGGLDNFLQIHADKAEYGPGDNVKFTLKSKANSFIGLRGIDQSVTLLGKEDPDITRIRINAEINSFDQRYYGWFNEDAVPSFDKASLIMLTNGGVDVKKKYKPRYYNAPPKNFAQAGAIQSASNMPFAAASDSVQPEAMAMKMGGAEMDAADNELAANTEVTVRKKFPETWIWADLEPISSEDRIYEVEIPETLTSWLVTGFSLNDVDGLGVADPTKLKTFRSFFITLNTPPFVIRKEIVTFQVLVHNYLSEEVTALITFNNTEKHFVVKNNTDKQRVTVKPNSVGSVNIIIEPQSSGYKDLVIKAVSKLAGDAVQVPLLVKPPGETRTKVRSVLMDIRPHLSGTPPERKFNVSINFPPKRVEGADKVRISFIGDMLGQSLANLESLIQLPVGCGEQNLLSFVPDIVVMDYLKATGRLTDEIRAKTILYLEQGYQRELTYRHPDGSFSAFGSADTYGSTWLTAFVARSFLRAKRFITIDEKVVKEALTFLTEKQEQNGNFIESGRVVHDAMTGGSGRGVPITAYTLLSFIEYTRMGGKNASKFAETISRGLGYLKRTMEKTEDFYTLSLINYALHLAEDGARDAAYKKLQAQWQLTQREYFLENQGKNDKLKHPWESPNRAKSSVVESIAYYLLTMFYRGQAEESLPFIRKLMNNMNDQGGFTSTQDTIVGLTALAEFAEKIYSPSLNLQIKMATPKGPHLKNLRIIDENSMVTQDFEVPADVNWFGWEVEGSGVAFAQVTMYYNILNETEGHFFRLEATPSDLWAEKFTLTTCFGLAPTFEGNRSNMAVLEVNLPTGMSFDGDELAPLLKQTRELKRYDRDREFRDTKIFLYFDAITRQRVCLNFAAVRTHKVANMAPAYILLYDYYDNERRERIFYTVRTSTGNDVY